MFLKQFFSVQNTDGKITYTVVPQNRGMMIIFMPILSFIDFSYLSLMKSTFDKKKNLN
jgi:hypothetical protein